MDKISRVIVLGFGVMGRGVATSFARAGFEITVVSRRAAALTGSVEGLTFRERLPARAPDLIIENLPEDPDTKVVAYREIEALYGGRAILATNTSGLPLTELEKSLQHSEMFCGTHYFMPAESCAVVEVMACSQTRPEVLDVVARALNETGKYTIKIEKPITGYVVNRLQHAILHEAYNLIKHGVVKPAVIDEAARLMLGPRMCITGLVEQKDISGLAIHAYAQRSIVPTFDNSGVPNSYLQNLVERNETGLGTGLGFYDWRSCDPVTVRNEVQMRLQDLTRFLADMTPRPDVTRPKSR